ncbi:MAG TPA: DUF5957 family protein [Acidimicrobiales bacterium]
MRTLASGLTGFLLGIVLSALIGVLTGLLNKRATGYWWPR